MPAEVTRTGVVIACACAVSCGRAKAFELQELPDLWNVDPAPRTVVVADDVRSAREAARTVVAPNVVVRAPEQLSFGAELSDTRYAPDFLSCYRSAYELLSTWSDAGELVKLHPESGLYACAAGYCKFTHPMTASELSLDHAWSGHGVDEVVAEFTVRVDPQLWPTGPGVRGDGRPVIARIGERWHDIQETVVQTLCPNNMILEKRSPSTVFSQSLCTSRTERCEGRLWTAYLKYLQATLTSAPFAAEEMAADGRAEERSVFVRRDKHSLMLGRPYLESSRYVGRMTLRLADGESLRAGFEIDAYVLVKKNPNRNEPYRDTSTNEASPYELALGRLEPARAVCASLRGSFTTDNEGETRCLPKE